MKKKARRKKAKRRYRRKPQNILNPVPEVAKYSDQILGGLMLCIDPSSGSRGSMPGYAYFQAGELIESGIIEVNPNQKPHIRLAEIGAILRDREQFPEPDVLILEEIKSIRGKFKPPMSLLWACGVIASSFSCPLIEVAPKLWTKIRDDAYEKSDEEDARYIGKYVIGLAKAS